MSTASFSGCTLPAFFGHLQLVNPGMGHRLAGWITEWIIMLDRTGFDRQPQCCEAVIAPCNDAAGGECLSMHPQLAHAKIRWRSAIGHYEIIVENPAAAWEFLFSVGFCTHSEYYSEAASDNPHSLCPRSIDWGNRDQGHCSHRTSRHLCYSTAQQDGGLPSRRGPSRTSFV